MVIWDECVRVRRLPQKIKKKTKRKYKDMPQLSFSKWKKTTSRRTRTLLTIKTKTLHNLCPIRVKRWSHVFQTIVRSLHYLSDELSVRLSVQYAFALLSVCLSSCCQQWQLNEWMDGSLVNNLVCVGAFVEHFLLLSLFWFYAILVHQMLIIVGTSI